MEDFNQIQIMLIVLFFYYTTNSKELYVIKTDGQINRFKPIKEYLHALLI